MKLRRVLSARGPQVEALQDEQSQTWVRLSAISALNEIAEQFSVKANLATNILSVLALGPDGWQLLSEHITQVKETSPLASKVLIPFQPLSFRDFLLFEQHFIDATRGFAKRFLPKKYAIASFYESLTGKVYPKFKPFPLWYKKPLYYMGNHLNFITSGEEIIKPHYTNALDYELELGAILIKPLYNASTSEAEKAIGGYVVLNDLSARDVQMAEMKSGFGPQKAKHFLNAMSAVVVTADEIAEINQLQGSVSIDGVECAQCTTASMQYSLAEAIAFASQGEALYPGELFGSGTLPGGCALENDHWLSIGSELTLQITGVGTLTNKIVEQSAFIAEALLP